MIHIFLLIDTLLRYLSQNFMATNTIPPIKVPAMPPRDCVNNKTNKEAVVADNLVPKGTQIN